MITLRTFLFNIALTIGLSNLSLFLPAYSVERPKVAVTGGITQGVIENGSLAF